VKALFGIGWTSIVFAVTLSAYAMDSAVLLEQLKSQVSPRLHDLWRTYELPADPDGRLGRISRWKLANGRTFGLETVSNVTFQEYVDTRARDISLDTTGRVSEAFAMREVIEIPKEQAVDSAGHLVPLSTEDGKYQGYKAAKIGDTYYALGRVINEAQTAQRVKTGQFVAPMIDIGALTGAELTTGWAMDNALAAEIAARRVYQALAEGKEMSLDTLNGIREGVNKDFLAKQGSWLKVHQATANEQIRIERVAQQLSQDQTIAGAEAALIGKFVELGNNETMPSAFSLHTLPKSLLQKIYDIGMTAQKDRSKVEAVLESFSEILAKHVAGHEESYAGLKVTEALERVQMGSAIAQGLRPNFSAIEKALQSR